MDSLFHDILGMHFLEPIRKEKIKYKVKPVMKFHLKNPDSFVKGKSHFKYQKRSNLPDINRSVALGRKDEFFTPAIKS